MSQIVGAKSILRYLSKQHGIDISRDTLYRLRFRTDPDREFSGSDIEAGASEFPAAPRFNGIRSVVAADTDEIDSWVLRHRRKKAAESA